VYVTVGLLWFTQIENLEMVDAIVLITIIFTTVGYSVHENANRVFLTLYCVSGVALVGTGFSLLAEQYLVNMFNRQEKKLRFLKQDRVTINNEKNFFLDSPAYFTEHWMQFAVWASGISIGGIMVGFCEGWSIHDAIYYGFVTGSTIGFGDLEPKSYYGKVVAALFLPFAILTTGVIFAQIFKDTMTSLFDEKCADLLEFQRDVETLLNKSNFEERFSDFDADGDGNLTMSEFMCQVLINEFDVPDEKLRLIEDAFHKLDTKKKGVLTSKVKKAKGKRKRGCGHDD